MYQVINKILDYIEDHIQIDIKLEDVSQTMYYSPWYISRSFNYYVGLSFNDYINKRRLSLAALMIKNSEKPIEFVAHHYGYNSAKYFSSLFKKQYHLSPREYRMKNYFVDLQIKRIIKGDQKMKILNLSQLVIEIMKNSSHQNELLDTISIIENCFLIEQKDSDIVLIAYCLNEENDYELMQLDFNLVNGKYVSKLILTTESKDIVINNLFVEEETIYVEYKNLLNQKTIQAKLIKVEEPKVQVATNVSNEVENANDEMLTFNSQYFNDIANKIKESVKELKNANHIYELEEYVKKDPDLLLLRGFGKEFVLIKLIKNTNHLFLYSIYLNFEKEIDEINHIYAANKGDKEVKFVLENHVACIYLNGTLHSQSFINVGEEVPPKFIISFPQGMTGRGKWDISNLFLK